MIADFVHTSVSEDKLQVTYNLDSETTMLLLSNYAGTINLHISTHHYPLLKSLISSIIFPTGTEITEFAGAINVYDYDLSFIKVSVKLPPGYNWFELDFSEFNRIVFGMYYKKDFFFTLKD